VPKLQALTRRKLKAFRNGISASFQKLKIGKRNYAPILRTFGYVENIFGYRIYIFDRLEGRVFKSAIACVPQSTVACLINRGYKNIHDHEPDIQILLQVHDSLAGQYPIPIAEHARAAITRHCTIPLPYSSGDLTIPVSVKTSRLSWGDCE
jgi:hypothetical protein